MNLRKKSIGILFALTLAGSVCFGTVSASAAPAKTATVVTTQKDSSTTAKKKATIKLSKSKVSLERGHKITLKKTIKNSDTKKVVWKSSNKKVATVNQNGQVQAKKKGSCTITARISGTSTVAKCKVSVKNYVTMRVKTTGYCNCSKCAGQWAGAPTASGTRPKQGRTIAVDKRLIRLGTKVQIGGRTYVAEDTGSAIKGKKIDIYYSSHKRAQSHGVKYQTIKVFM